MGAQDTPGRCDPTASRVISLLVSPLRRAVLAGVLLCLAAVGCPPVHAAQRVEVVDAPSLAGNIDLARARVNGITNLQARVVLPDGYGASPGRRWPLLLLLHGVGDNSSTWLDPRKGDLLGRAKGLPAIIVLAEGGRGYFTDAWLGGERRGVNWER